MAADLPHKWDLERREVEKRIYGGKGTAHGFRDLSADSISGRFEQRINQLKTKFDGIMYTGRSPYEKTTPRRVWFRHGSTKQIAQGLQALLAVTAISNCLAQEGLLVFLAALLFAADVAGEAAAAGCQQRKYQGKQKQEADDSFHRDTSFLCA